MRVGVTLTFQDNLNVSAKSSNKVEEVKCYITLKYKHFIGGFKRNETKVILKRRRLDIFLEGMI